MGMITNLFHDQVVGKKCVSVPEVANCIGIAPATLYGKLNPYDNTQDLNLWQAERVSEFMGDYTPFIKFLESKGFKVLAVGDETDTVSEANCLMKAAEIGAACGKVADLVVTAMKNDGLFDKTELAEILSASVDAHRILERFYDGARKAVLKAV